MRLCYLADPRSIHTRRWLDYFVQRGHEVHLLTAHTEFPFLDGVKVYPILALPPFMKNLKRGQGWLAFLVSSQRVRRLLQAIAPDLLHAHFIKYYGWLAARSGFHPLIITAWGGDILAEQGAFSLGGRWLTP